MTVLQRSHRSLGHGDSEPLDLHKANLWEADLSGAHITERTIFYQAVIRVADFSKADPCTIQRHLEAANGDKTTWIPPRRKFEYRDD